MRFKNMKRILLFTLSMFHLICAFSQTNNAQPFTLGFIERLWSKELNETRILNIYVPDGYDENDTATYPVIYLLDGSADEDFIHVVGLVQFNSFEWISRVPKSIVVGIATVDRRRDFTYPTTVEGDKLLAPTGGYSKKFISFIEKELQPFIEKKFRTSTTKTIIGQSLGGLLATEILLKKPALFSKYIIVSPSLWWDNGSLLNQSTLKLQDSSLQATDVFIAVGKEGLTPTKIPRVMEVDAHLLEEKIHKADNKKIKVYLDYLPTEDHATILHQAIYDAFKILYLKAGNK